MRWLILDRLYNAEAYDFGHLDSYGHYLEQAGEEVFRFCLGGHRRFPAPEDRKFDVVFALDGYEQALTIPARVHIAQVACDTVVPPGFSAVISSIPAMVDFYRARGENAVFMPLAFDTRALVCGMGVRERDIPCLFVGSRGSNHRKREEILAALGGLVTIAPPTFGREMFRLLARARVVVNVHAEWAHGAANAMRLVETAGMGASIVTDGEFPPGVTPFGWGTGEMTADDFRSDIEAALRQPDGAMDDQAIVLQQHSYVQRVPRLIEIARSL